MKITGKVRAIKALIELREESIDLDLSVKNTKTLKNQPKGFLNSKEES